MTDRMTAVAKLPEKWREDDDCSALEYAERLRCADELEAALSPAELGGVEGAVACHRLCTGDPPSRWMWIDGPASLGAMDQARLHGWRIENAYATPRAAEAEWQENPNE